MFNKNKIFLLVLLSLILAQPKISNASSCVYQNGYDILKCALNNNPNLIRAKDQAPVFWQYEKQSEKWFAPELDAGLNYKRADDDKGIEMEVAILQNIENPNKREARKSIATAEYENSKLQIEEEENKTVFDVLTILNRLRQLSQEKEIVSEAIITYQTVLKKYKNFSGLSPEEEVSKDVFEMALKNNQIEKQRLIDEENSYLSQLSTMVGQNQVLDLKKQGYLYAPEIFPIISNINIESSIEMEKEKINVNIAKANYAEAKASNFSGLNVGPYIATKPGSMGRLDTYGFKLSLPIPVNSNKNGIKGADFALKAAEQSQNLKKLELEQNISLLTEKYNQGKNVLKDLNPSNLEARHQKLEKAFLTGRVSPSLFIDAHEQLISAIKTYNSYELETLQSLWTIYAIKKSLVENYREVSYAK